MINIAQTADCLKDFANVQCTNNSPLYTMGPTVNGTDVWDVIQYWMWYLQSQGEGC